MHQRYQSKVHFLFFAGLLIFLLSILSVQTVTAFDGNPDEVNSALPLKMLQITPTPVPSNPTTGLVSMAVSADPQEAPLDQLFTINISLSGDSSKCGQSVVVKPVDVYLVIDHSGSMGDNDKLKQAQLAAASFLDEMDFSRDRVGIVQFDDSAQVLFALSDKPNEIKTSIDSIEIAGGTDVANGLTEAYEAIKSDRRTDAVPVIIVLSDGQSDASSIKHAADTAKADGMVVVAVGLGEDVDEDAMKGMASLNSDGTSLYYYAPDPSKLQDVYIAIAHAIRKYGLAKDITVQFQVDIYRYKIVSDSIVPAGTIAGDTITWQRDILDTGDSSFVFQVRGRDAGEYPVGKLIEAKFLECEQNEQDLRIENSPVVQITQISDPPPAPSTCTWLQKFPWWVLVPLILLLVILLLGWTSTGSKFIAKLSTKPLICRLLALLFLISLLILSALIAKAIFGDLCKTNELYFWKLVQAGDVGIYQTTFDGEKSSPVKSLNQGSNCVACHDVSSQKLVTGIRNAQNGDVTVVQRNGNGVPIPAINASYVAWSSDGKRLALSYNDADIYILDIESGSLEPLSGAADPTLVETMPAWSPDGLTIAFVRTTKVAPAPDTAEIVEPCDIYTVPSSGGNALPLPGASGRGFNYYPVYSPDGKWLAFTHHVDGTDTYADQAADIYIVPSAGIQNPVRLSINSESADSWPSWSPDSKWLGFSSNRRNGQFDILVSPIGDNGQPYELQYDKEGNRSAVFKIAGAAMDEDEEFHPVWVSIDDVPLANRVFALWPWFIPLLILPILMWLFCRQRKYTLSVDVVDGLTGRPIENADITYKIEARGGLNERQK